MQKTRAIYFKIYGSYFKIYALYFPSFQTSDKQQLTKTVQNALISCFSRRYHFLPYFASFATSATGYMNIHKEAYTSYAESPLCLSQAFLTTNQTRNLSFITYRLHSETQKKSRNQMRLFFITVSPKAFILPLPRLYPYQTRDDPCLSDRKIQEFLYTCCGDVSWYDFHGHGTQCGTYRFYR